MREIQEEPRGSTKNRTNFSRTTSYEKISKLLDEVEKIKNLTERSVAELPEYKISFISLRKKFNDEKLHRAQVIQEILNREVKLQMM